MATSLPAPFWCFSVLHACRSWRCGVRRSLTNPPRGGGSRESAEGGSCGCACRGGLVLQGGMGPTWDLVNRAWAVGVGDVERVRSVIHLQVNKRQMVCVMQHDCHWLCWLTHRTITIATGCVGSRTGQSVCCTLHGCDASCTCRGGSKCRGFAQWVVSTVVPLLDGGLEGVVRASPLPR